MLVYNIRKEKYAKKLTSSGFSNRWNKDEEYVIYSSSSIALAALELIAHRSAIQIDSKYRLLTIQVETENSDIQEALINDLPTNWKSITSYPALQEIGSDWYKNNHSLLLKVPSSLIPIEYNYLINTRHPLFHKKVHCFQ